jgi:hypothetical protein
MVNTSTRTREVESSITRKTAGWSTQLGGNEFPPWVDEGDNPIRWISSQLQVLEARIREAAVSRTLEPYIAYKLARRREGKMSPALSGARRQASV